jgi:membrane protein DedA with SNARE-associated domain
MSIGSIIETYGYWAVFGLVAAESLGIPLPAETALILASIYAGQSHHLNPWLIWAVACAGAIVGDNIGFWIGDKGGYALARRYGPKVHLDERKLKTARYLFDRHGGKVVFFGRFVSILRAYAAFLAGVSKMRWHIFLAANAAGGILWAAIYTFAAYLAGSAFERLSKTLNIVLLICGAIAIVAALLAVRHEFGKYADRAEAAYPGPLELSPVRGEGKDEDTWVLACYGS